MTGYISKKMLGAARLPDTPTARAYLRKVLDNDKDHGDALTIAYQSGYYDGKKAAQPVGQAPCVRHCESTAFEIVIRGLKGDIERMKAAQRTWVSLTDDQIKEIVGPWGDTPIKGYTRKLIDQIDAKLRENNNG
jgi:hypothetical protein